MLEIVGWCFISIVTLAAAVWAWVNYGGGYGKSLRYQLPQPGNTDSSQGSGTSVPVSGDPRDLKPTGTEVPEPPPDQNTPQAERNMPGVNPGAGKVPGGVAIFSPGRDEAEHLPTVLPELCEQDYPDLRVVFIDDASTDATADITQAMAERYDNLLVVRNEDEPPAGWMGKCWAIHRGVNALKSKVEGHTADASRPSTFDLQAFDPEWYCFTDADIHWHPQLLRTALDHALEHDADLLGVTPTLEFGSVGEAVVQLQLVLALGLMLPFEKAMDPDSPYALTGGAFILVKRSFYDRIGGHTAVKGEMVEDLKIGMALKAAGAKHRVALAGKLQTCRMYDGWADMWEGLTKNAYAGVNHRWWLALGMGLVVLLINIGPVFYAVAAAAWLAVSPGLLPGVALLLSGLTLLWQARALNGARKLMHLPWGYAWSLPMGSAVYLAIIAASVWQYHTKGNAWKGRRYAATSE